MKRPKRYMTKQREDILFYVASLGGAHITARQIDRHFKQTGSSIGLTTVYRHLEKLAESGIVRKYTMGGITGACFQYIQDNEECMEHFHLKCEDCGALLHLRCKGLEEIGRHVYDEHAFQINKMKTVFYGICAECMDKGDNSGEE